MSHDGNHKEKYILFCSCRGERVDPGLISGIESFLKMAPVNTYKIHDLCGTLQEKNDQLQRLFRNRDEYLVIGCYRRTMDLLLSQVAIPLNYKHINLIESNQEETFRQISDFCSDGHEEQSLTVIDQASDKPAWYPVIDYSRCTNCGQCADFCLFGVYEKTENRVNVVNPENCKNNCPACARICPSTAIIFPKYKHGGAIGGSDEVNEQEELQRQARDINDFLGGDISAALEKRKARRQSIIRQEVMNKAISERESALKESMENKNSKDVNI